MEKLLSQLANAAYLDRKECLETIQSLGYEKLWALEYDGAQAYLIECDDKAIIAFRGTEPEWNDISADLDFFKDDGFHSGFLEEYYKLSKAADEWIKERSHLDLYITGHSLGAAMATICAYHNPQAKELVTFGSPRVANRSVVKEIKVPHKRFVNNNDIVPKIPFAWLGYVHHGDLQYINYEGEWAKMSLLQISKDQWKGRKRAFEKGEWFDGVYDHSMDEYVKKLNNLL